MKKLISKVLTVVLVCTIASANAQWAKKADFVNFNTLGEGFSINGKGYVCGGSSEGLVMYDPVTDTWTRKTRFPAIGTFNNAYSFVIGDKAYFGIDDSLYEYNSITDTWAIKNVQPFRYRFGSKGFSINNKGYLVGGYDYSPGNKSVYFYEYDPATDTWTRKADVPIPTGKDLLNPRTLVYNGKAYIHGYDLMSYDPTTNVWTTEPLPSCNPTFAQVYSCVVGDYFVGGYNKFAKINMVTKQCEQIDTIPEPNGPIKAAASFSIGSKLYVVAGMTGTIGVLKSTWVYETGISTGIKQVDVLQNINIYPNPAGNLVTLTNLSNNSAVNITDLAGKQVYSTIANTTELSINTASFANGVYLVNVTNNGVVAIKKLVISK